jgi:D-sedoheptulose 7-phosphate isomerase
VISKIQQRFDESVEVAGATREQLPGRIAEAVEMMVAAYREGGGVFVFGNGGSAADAQHIVGELVGRFLAERKAFRAEALSANASTLTSLANDYGYEQVFARQLEGVGRAGDVAVGLSTSGNSANVAAGLAKAREIGMKTIAMTGTDGGKCGEFADVLLNVPSDSTPRIQEAHTIIYHVLCELIEQALAP